MQININFYFLKPKSEWNYNEKCVTNKLNKIEK